MCATLFVSRIIQFLKKTERISQKVMTKNIYSFKFVLPSVVVSNKHQQRT